MNGVLGRYMPPALTVVALIVIWHLVVVVQKLPSHLLPGPELVGRRLASGLISKGDFWPHLRATLQATLLGFAGGSAAAVTLAFAFSELAVLRRLFFYLIVGFQAVPKVALAPLMLIWLGFGLQSKVVLVALVCFYPVFTATSVALESVNPDLRDMMRAAGASRLHRLRHLDLPAVTGPILTGLQISFGFALIGCVVMEFVLGTEGAGYLIDNSANSLDAATAVASMIILGVIGAAGTLAIRATRERFVFWDAGTGGVEPSR